MGGRDRTALAVWLAIAAGAIGACGGNEEDTTTTTTGPTGATGASGLSDARARKLAHVDESTGVTDGLALDTRKGRIELPEGSFEAGHDLAALADQGGCELMLDLPDEGNAHQRAGDDVPEYGTTPPTSGDHDPVPQADGAYLETPDVTKTVHSLEHGRVAIQYSPALSEGEQVAVKGVFDASPDGSLMFPNPEMPYALAATAWTNLIGCQEYSPEALLAIAEFRNRFLGKGPERVPL
jgi:hypothetical protein